MAIRKAKGRSELLKASDVAERITHNVQPNAAHHITADRLVIIEIFRGLELATRPNATERTSRILQCCNLVERLVRDAG